MPPKHAPYTVRAILSRRQPSAAVDSLTAFFAARLRSRIGPADLYPWRPAGGFWLPTAAGGVWRVVFAFDLALRLSCWQPATRPAQVGEARWVLANLPTHAELPAKLPTRPDCVAIKPTRSASNVYQESPIPEAVYRDAHARRIRIVDFPRYAGHLRATIVWSSITSSSVNRSRHVSKNSA
jgi:hypothetical protein